MTLLRRALGETLRGQRLRQRRTLREVSAAARVSLGYLSEVERGQKEASSELLASICEALDVRLSDVLRQVSDSLRRTERVADVARAPVAPARQLVPAGAARGAGPSSAAVPIGGDGAEFGVDLDLPMDFDPGELDRVGLDATPSDGPAQDQVAAGPVDELDPARFADRSDPGELDAERMDADQPDAERFGPGERDPARPRPDRTGLDGIDLADLETGDGFADVDALLSLTDLSGCLTDTHRPTACLAGAGAAA